jgi:hypothetical protein
MKSVIRTLKNLRHTKKFVIEFNTKSEAHINFLASSNTSFVDDKKRDVNDQALFVERYGTYTGYSVIHAIPYWY